jgi:DNA polymerase III epsilon subunit-like protein
MTPLVLGIDTETSGLVRPGGSVNDQPHIVQIAAKLCDPDAITPVASFHAIIRPDGWTIEPEAARIHKISEAEAYRVGIPLTAALVMLQALVEKARVIVAHNMEFDRALISAELARLNAGGRWWHSRTPDLRCTMADAADIMKIPGDYGDYRWPKLTEAWNFFHPDQPPMVSTHRAEDDVQTCIEIFQALQLYRAFNARVK